MDYVYDTVPKDIDVPRLAKDSIKQYLKESPGKFYKTHALAIRSGLPNTGTRVEVRKAVTELVNEGCPIVGGPKGYSWASHPNMVKFYIESLQWRKQGIERRIKALKIAMDNMPLVEPEVVE